MAGQKPVFLTTGQAARLLGISIPKVREAAKRGEIPHVTTGEKRLRQTFDLRDVVSLKEKKERGDWTPPMLHRRGGTGRRRGLGAYKLRRLENLENLMQTLLQEVRKGSGGAQE